MGQDSDHNSSTTAIVLLAALHDELAVTLDRLNLTPAGDNHYIGQLGQTKIVAAIIGMGASRAATAATRVLDQHQPHQVVLVGFAGGLDPQLAPGSVLAIKWITDEHGSTLQLGNSSPPLSEHPADRSIEHSLLTVNRVVESVAAKHELFRQHHCAAVDMETYHVAKVCAQHGVPLTVWRAITDPADMTLPAQAIQWVKPNGHADIPAAARHLATHPWQVPLMLTLRKHAKLAAQRLADCVQQTLAEYTTPSPHAPESGRPGTLPGSVRCDGL